MRSARVEEKHTMQCKKRSHILAMERCLSWAGRAAVAWPVTKCDSLLPGNHRRGQSAAAKQTVIDRAGAELTANEVSLHLLSSVQKTEHHMDVWLSLCSLLRSQHRPPLGMVLWGWSSGDGPLGMVLWEW